MNKLALFLVVVLLIVQFAFADESEAAEGGAGGEGK
jgi:hypothetical protein